MAQRIRRAPGSLVATCKDPVTLTDLMQVCKTVVAAVAAWLLAREVFGLPQPFLAPWAALLTVHSTVYRSMTEGFQSVSATGLGIGLSFVVAQALGLGALTLGATMFLGLILARTQLLRTGGVTIATTAIFVITTGYVQQESILLNRLMDTGIGVATGVAVNLLVVAPLNDRSAARQVDRIASGLGDLMTEIAADLHSTWTAEDAQDWIERTREMDNDLHHAWQLVRHAHESSWWNPWRRLSRRVEDPTQYEQILRRLEEGIAQMRSMARTINESTQSAHEWDTEFREPWIELLTETGKRISRPDFDVHAMHDRVDNLTRKLSGEDLPGLRWPIYGALISNLLHVIDIVDDVATSRPIRT